MKTFLFAFLFSQIVLAKNFSAQVFELNGDPQKDTPLYKMKHDETLNGDKTQIHSLYSYMDGKEALSEDVEVHGTKLISYKLHQKQLGDEGSVEIKDDKVIFTYQPKDHDAKTSTENAVENLVVGPTIVPYARAHWNEIKAGKKVAIRLALPDRRETVGFVLVKDDSSTDAKTIVKMKASSLLISAIVEPLYFTFLPDGSEMQEMRGRSPVKREKDGKFKDLDAHTIYKLE